MPQFREINIFDVHRNLLDVHVLRNNAKDSIQRHREYLKDYLRMLETAKKIDLDWHVIVLHNVKVMRNGEKRYSACKRIYNYKDRPEDFLNNDIKRLKEQLNAEFNEELK